MNQRQIQDYADELGRLKAERKAIEDREMEIKLLLLQAGVKTGMGAEYQFQFVTTIRNVTDWERVAGKYRPSRQLVTAHTTRRPVDALRVSVRG